MYKTIKILVFIAILVFAVCSFFLKCTHYAMFALIFYSLSIVSYETYKDRKESRKDKNKHDD